MTPPDHVQTLLHKAQQDEAVLEKLAVDPAFDDETVGFHAQQAAEKLLKALLVHHGVDYPRTHSIGLLLDLLATAGAALPADLNEVEQLTPFGTVFRYDDLRLAAKDQRPRWLPMIRALRQFIESKITKGMV